MTEASQHMKLFLEACESDPRKQEVLDKLLSAGCELPHVLASLRLYVENRPFEGREKRAQSRRAHVNRGVRTSQLSVATAREWQSRITEASKPFRSGVSHCVDSLVWVEAYIEFKTGKLPTAPALAFLIDAATESLGRKAEDTTPANVRRQLTRFKEENPGLNNLIRADIGIKFPTRS